MPRKEANDISRQSQRIAAGMIEYRLTRKPVKRINLRVKADGAVVVSAAPGVSINTIDAFIVSKAAWIMRARAAAAKAPRLSDADRFTNAQALALFESVSEKVYNTLKGALCRKPTLIVRKMKSSYGLCRPQQYTITLNKLLVLMPDALIEYVVLHEYIHFFHPNHQKGFHRMMAQYMPDYRQRRKALREVSRSDGIEQPLPYTTAEDLL